MICMKQKKAFLIAQKGLIKNRQRLTLPGFTPVPSALVGLTALFGMGRGDPHRYCHLKVFASCLAVNILDMIVVKDNKEYERAHSVRL